jgi:hypothetical protein
LLLLKQSLKSLLAKQNQKQQSNTSSDSFSDTDSSSFTVDSFVQSPEIRAYKFISILLSIVFSILFLINLSLNFQLSSLKAELDKKVIASDATTDLEREYISVVKSLAVYKTVKGTKASIYPKTQLLYTDLPEGVSLDKLKVSATSFDLTLSGGNALLFSQFLSSVSRNPLVSTVILDSASLNSGTDNYVVSVKGVFK